MYRPHHVSLSVTNLDASIAFYCQLGFSNFHHWQAPDGALTITHLVNHGFILELFCYQTHQAAPESIYDTATDLPVIGTKHFGLKVDSIEEARQDLLEKGLIDDTIHPKQGRTGPIYFFVKDPDGILVEIAEDKRRPGRL